MHVGAANIAWTHDIWEDALHMHKKHLSLNGILKRLKNRHPGFQISRSQLHANLRAYALEGPTYKPYSLHPRNPSTFLHLPTRTNSDPCRRGAGSDSRSTVLLLRLDEDQLWNLKRRGLSLDSCNLEERSSLEHDAVNSLVSMRVGSKKSPSPSWSPERSQSRPRSHSRLPSQLSASSSECSEASESDDSQTATASTGHSTPRDSPVLDCRSINVTRDLQPPDARLARRMTLPPVSSLISNIPPAAFDAEPSSYSTAATDPSRHAWTAGLLSKSTSAATEAARMSYPTQVTPAARRDDGGRSLLLKAVIAGNIAVSQFLLANGANLHVGDMSDESIGDVLKRCPEREPQIQACLDVVREYQSNRPVLQAC